ncbi:MAG: patatin [Xanthomonadales bacterium]|nr:patatin-like phospholipase family protein [Xanthomonadales bacterium]NIX12659.1 patatin [Xanthomonadales bacterium]
MGDYHFRNLVFEGGGVKGIAYVGALKELDERDILPEITRVGGTSAGAINAVLLALGYTLDETRDILSNLDFNNFMDDSWGVVRDTRRLIDEFGWYKGDFFYEWMGELIGEKTGNRFSTFNDLKNSGFKDLYLVGTNISTGYSEVFSGEHTPRQRVADAARISMSIPLFFRAIRNTRDDVYVDGGVLKNYPIKLFDREKYIENALKHAVPTDYYDNFNADKPDSSSPYCYNKETLGFRLDSKEEIAMFRDGAEPAATEVDDFFDYTLALIKTVLNAQNNAHLHSDDWQRTVYVDSLGVGTTDFDLSDERKEELVKSGEDGVKSYFDWFDNVTDSDLPNNHPEFKP